MILTFIYIHIFYILFLIYLYKGVFNLPVLFFLFMSIYNLLPTIGILYFDANWNLMVGGLGYISLIPDAFMLHFYGATAYFIACLISMIIWRKENITDVPLKYYVRDDIALTCSIAFVLVITGVFLTGQVYSIGRYGVGEYANSPFSILIHFTAIIFTIASFYTYKVIYEDKIKINLVLIQILIIIFLYLLIGTRSMIVGTALILIYSYTSRNINIIRDLLLVLSGFVFLLFIQQFRDVKSIYGASSISSVSDGSLWIEGFRILLTRWQDSNYVSNLFFSGQGDQIGILTEVMHKVSNDGFMQGYTYLEALPRLIPSFFRRPLGIPDDAYIFDFLGYLDNCTWCAFGLNVELYLNFGLYGIIIGLFVIGIFFGFLKKKSNLNRPYTMLLMLNMFPFITTLARNSSPTVIKQFVYILIVLSVLYLFHIAKKKLENNKQ